MPTELISENGVKLKEIIIKLAEIHQLGADFIHWIETANYFCNTLVDRIVPGKYPLINSRRQKRNGAMSMSCP